jgi:hypothetical protein
LPSKALLLTIAMLFCYTSQTGLPPLAAIGRAAFGKTSRRRASLEVREGLARHGARALMAVAFLPFEVIVTMDAIVRALYRMLLNRRKLLEWSPMAQTGRAIGSRMTRRFAWREMSTATFAVLLLAVVVVRTSPAVWIAAPLLILWLVAPQLAYWTALPSRQVQ